jgi:hypothetical protein
VLGVVTYLLCYIWHLLVPSAIVGAVLQSAFPGFSWSPVGFLIGLAEVIVYSFYTAAVFVPAYNLLGHRGPLAAGGRAQAPRQPAR